MTALCRACNNPWRIQGFCLIHYRQWQRAGCPDGWRPPAACTVDGCERSVHCRGKCKRHYDLSRSPCTEQGCTRPVHAKNLCQYHYRTRDRVQVTWCSVGGCDNRPMHDGLCTAHYHRRRRTGSVYGAKALPQHDLVRLRRAVGLPDDGPTTSHRERWAREEARG